MKIIRQNKFKARMIAKLVRILNRLENDDNTEPPTNGENNFISHWCRDHCQSPALTVFDVGANIGEYADDVIAGMESTPFKGKLEVHAFEPSSSFERLAGRFEAEKRVMPVHAGLSDKECDMPMYGDKDGSKLTTVHVRDRANYKAKWVPTGAAHFVRADEYIERGNIRHIDLVKIDVEGHELSVLRGFGKYLDADFIDYIQFEYSEANMDAHTTLYELYEILENAGFVVAKIMPRHLEIRPYSRGYEHYHYSNWVAIGKLEAKTQVK